MKTCTPIPKTRCLPTPFVGHQSATRWVRLRHCQVVSLKSNLVNQMHGRLINPRADADDPLTAEQYLRLIEVLDAHMPEEAPVDCCMEIELRLTEIQIYELNRRRVYAENYLATLITQCNPNLAGGRRAARSIEQSYSSLTELQKQLAPPIGPARGGG